MTLPKIIAYAWIFSVLLSVVIAADRGDPILHAFAPMKSFRAFCWQLALAGVICLLAAWQLFDDSGIFGQQPMTWGFLLMMVYAWACLGAYFRRKD